MTEVFEVKIIELFSKLIIRIPDHISKKLSSRGMVMAKGQIKSMDFELPLEPDGKGGHWFEILLELAEKAGVKSGDLVSIWIEPVKDWKDPEMPKEFMMAIQAAGVKEKWYNITSKAKWDWLRWIRSTKNIETRNKRIEVACSKLQNDDHRPCCFNRNICTVVEVSKGGILISDDHIKNGGL